MKRLSIFLAAGLISKNCPADADTQIMAFMCLNCHAPQTAQAAVPALDNLTAAQISQKLLDFKYDRLAATIMPRLAKGYSDQELQKLADYLGKH
ncbi:MAG: hypothetical protein ABSB19_04185 [Methylomonas sp.]|jgi:sulfide dehydrogenase cytochrome subunit